MNRGFKFYFSKGRNLTFYSLKKVSLKSKCCIACHFLASFLGRLLIFTRPLAEIADQNMAAMIEGSRNLSFEKMFEGVTKERYWNLLVSYLVADLVLFFTLAFVSVIPSLLLMLLDGTTAALVAHYVLSILGIVPAILISLNAEPYAFIAARTTKLNASDYLFNAKESIKGSRKTIVALNIVYWLISSILLLVVAGGIVFVNSIGSSVTGLLMILIIALGMFLYFALFQKYDISLRVSKFLLFKDVVSTKKTIVVKPVNGKGLQYEPVFVDSEQEFELTDLSKKVEGK